MTRLLIVDDDTKWLQQAALYFEKEGFELVSTSSDAEAMNILEGKECDIAIIDIQLQGDRFPIGVHLAKMSTEIPKVLVSREAVPPQYAKEVFGKPLIRFVPKRSGLKAINAEIVQFIGSVGDIRPSKKKVFIVHGRNLKIKKELEKFLDSVGLDAISWEAALQASKEPNAHISSIIESGFKMAQAILVLFTPDDEGRCLPAFQKVEDEAHDKEHTPQARLNVIFEAGMAYGRDPLRTILVQGAKVRSFTDIGGRFIIDLRGGPSAREMLIEALKKAKCELDIKDDSWKKAGRFTAK